MAVVEIKSTQITNRDASPKVISNGYLTKGALYESVGTLETTASDSVGSTYNLCSIPSNARMSDLLISCDALGGTSAVNVGLYQTTKNGGAVVDADLFASALDVSAALTKSSILHESAVFGIEDVEKRLWEVLGLTEDPQIDYDVVATVSAATTSAATMSAHATFAI